MRSLHIAGTGMMAQQTNVEVISNNIANMSTTGYKRRRGAGSGRSGPGTRRGGACSRSCSCSRC
ncbi:flagellar basal body protein, partial [Teichococcus deserti]|uniref:flagellar basal body protein n=1 Tax=Teichococcus deserti TaxID=1817963 RepID=UPI001F61D526